MAHCCVYFVPLFQRRHLLMLAELKSSTLSHAAAGDHHAWAAFADAVLGWTMMQPGAALVFDDFW